KDLPDLVRRHPLVHEDSRSVIGRLWIDTLHPKQVQRSGSAAFDRPEQIAPEKVLSRLIRAAKIALEGLFSGQVRRRHRPTHSVSTLSEGGLPRRLRDERSRILLGRENPPQLGSQRRRVD